MSIYDQLGRALKQSVRTWGRSILYRGVEIPCMFHPGESFSKLGMGGLQSTTSAHVKVSRELVPIGSDGEPHTNETIIFPAMDGGGMIAKEYVIYQVIADEFSYSFELTDPSL